MTSTLKFTTTRTKNGVLSPFETLSALGAGPASPTSRTPETRRTARRFAHTGSPTKPGDSPPTPTEIEAELPSAVQSLVNTLLDPPDLEQRIRDYDYYMHYHTIDLLSDSSTAEPQDLQRYVRAAQLAAGQEVTEPSAETPGTMSAAAALQEGTERYEQYEPPKASVTYYENWLHT